MLISNLQVILKATKMITVPSYGMNPWLVWFKGFWMKSVWSHYEAVSAFVDNKYISQVEATNKSEFH